MSVKYFNIERKLIRILYSIDETDFKMKNAFFSINYYDASKFSIKGFQEIVPDLDTL